ncbi:MAG: hypothetical protein ISR65_02455 [Bacteriovoracaceae bacterium]|nr:hypothetical protein [Bacteriovoracaceae bacterium]
MYKLLMLLTLIIYHAQQVALGTTGLMTNCHSNLMHLLFDRTIDSAMQAPLPIKQTVRGLFPEELFQTGIVYFKDERIGPLENGEYIYLIDHHDRINIALRVPTLQANSERYLASHLGLHNHLLQIAHVRGQLGVVSPTLKKSIKTPLRQLFVLAAGEFRVVNKTVIKMNNRSGSWRGNNTHLDYARYKLANAGLEIHPEARILDEGKKASNLEHVDARKKGKIIYQIRSDEHSNYTAEKINTFYNLLMTRFATGQPGDFDINKLLEVIHVNKMPDEYFVTILGAHGSIMSEGVEYFLYQVNKPNSHFPLDKLLETIDILTNILN